MNEFIKELNSLIQNSHFFHRYGYKSPWVSGSSTTVHPIENYITGKRITIQLENNKQSKLQLGLDKLVQGINTNFGDGTVTQSYINMNDGSCPPVAVIYYQEPNYSMKQPVKLNESHLRNIIRESLRGLLNEGPGAGYYVTISGLHATNVHITGRSRKEDGSVIVNFKANLVPGIVSWEAENYDGKVTSKGIVYDGYLVDEFDDETNQVKGGNIAGYVYEEDVNDSFNNVDEPLTLQQVVEFINDKLNEFSFKTLVGSGYVHTNLSDPMSFEGVEATVSDSYYGNETVYMDVITIQAPGITEAINWFFENYYNFDEIYGGEEEQIQESVDEKAKSKAQQRFMGMVHAVQKGELDADEVGSSVAKAAKTMKKKDVKDFAKTKHKGLPNHVDESVLRKMIREVLEQTWTDEKPKDEMDNMYLQRYRRYGLTECLSDENCTIILEKYGLSDIFTLNEDGSGNIFQKFRQPLANAINKIKNTFGNKACQFVSDAIKNAQLKGRSTLYGVLTVITLLSGTLPMNAINTSDFEDSFQNNIMAATTNMTKERGITNGDELNNIKERAVDDFIRILYTLDDDVNNVYCASGVGCSENEHSAINLAKQDVLNNLKQKYGEDVVEKYGLEFKTIATQSWQEKTFVNGKPKYKSYYTAIIAAYKTINSNNPIRECVHQTLIKMIGKYTQGKVSSKEANKAIMDLANSSNGKINEDRNNRSFSEYAEEYYQKNGKKLPDDTLRNAGEKNDERFHEKNKVDGKHHYVSPNRNSKFGGKNTPWKDNLSESLDDEMAKWEVLSQDDFYKTLIQLRDVVKEDGIIDASDAINDYPATYCVYGSEPEYENRLPQLRNSIAKSVIRTLYNYDIICADENTLNINIENSNVPQAAELCVKLQQLANNQLNESYAKDGNYTHFAVNKTTNKIVNGWDYSGYDASELRQFARDYFTEDLRNYELDPKQYTILTRVGCKKRGINPDDDTQWANK